MHHHHVPGAAADDAELVLQVEIDIAAAAGFQVDVVLQAGLVGE
ncbi:MAG: hypothetical protein ACE37N_10400 [Pseudohongiellaceae bacterium]